MKRWDSFLIVLFCAGAGSNKKLFFSPSCLYKTKQKQANKWKINKKPLRPSRHLLLQGGCLLNQASTGDYKNTSRAALSSRLSAPLRVAQPSSQRYMGMHGLKTWALDLFQGISLDNKACGRSIFMCHSDSWDTESVHVGVGSHAAGWVGFACSAEMNKPDRRDIAKVPCLEIIEVQSGIHPQLS